MIDATELSAEAEVSVPSDALIKAVAGWGDVLVLGAGGKIGSGLSSMLVRAFAAAGNPSRVFAVSRWSDEEARIRLSDAGAVTLSADVSDPDALAGLPDVDRVVFLVGTKFGSSTQPDEAWMTNTILPAAVASRYPDARFSVLSSGNVYPFTEAWTGGADESVAPDPVGEYAITCLGRERVMQNAARANGTRVSIVRLNYACEVRYGVIADIAKRVQSGQPVDVSVGAVNVVSQRYVNDVVLRCLDHASDSVFTINLAGPETASVRWIAEKLGTGIGVEPIYEGTEGKTGLLSNAALCHQLFGYPDLTLSQMIQREIDWINGGGVIWNKPTKFERTDGKF